MQNEIYVHSWNVCLQINVKHMFHIYMYENKQKEYISNSKVNASEHCCEQHFYVALFTFKKRFKRTLNIQKKLFKAHIQLSNRNRRKKVFWRHFFWYFLKLWKLLLERLVWEKHFVIEALCLRKWKTVGNFPFCFFFLTVMRVKSIEDSLELLKARFLNILNDKHHGTDLFVSIDDKS